MQNRLESHVYCTSAKCAAVLWTFGGKFRVPPQGDSITIDIHTDGREEVRYHFYGTPDAGLQMSDIISAYSILVRGIPEGFVPKKEVLEAIKNADHPIVLCFRALEERDRLHRLYFDVAKGHAKAFKGDCVSITLTKLAACLSALGHQEIGVDFDGKNAHFQFENTPEINGLVDAYYAAWGKLLLPQAHALYWMKSVLDHRDEILIKKRDSKIEPFYVETRGGDDHLKIIKTPLNITPENLEKSKKYINS